MSQEQHSPREEHSRAQHRAEHRRAKKVSVVWYLFILFAVAFLLLLMSYFMQQRANEENLADIRDSISAMDTLDKIIAERDALKEENLALKDDLEDMTGMAEQARDSLLSSADQISALNKLNLIRKLYNQRRYDEARAFLADWEAAAPGALRAALRTVSDGLGDAERAIYDPVEAFDQLTSWLG